MLFRGLAEHYERSTEPVPDYIVLAVNGLTNDVLTTDAVKVNGSEFHDFLTLAFRDMVLEAKRRLMAQVAQ